METIKQFTEQKIKEYVDILNIQMTKENANEITYGDKFAALGGLNMAISIMKLIDPTFEFDLVEEMGLTEAMKKKCKGQSSTNGLLICRLFIKRNSYGKDSYKGQQGFY